MWIRVQRASRTPGGHEEDVVLNSDNIVSIDEDEAVITTNCSDKYDGIIHLTPESMQKFLQKIEII